MSIEGIPEGYRPVAFRKGRAGDMSIGCQDGTPFVLHDDTSTSVLIVEPVATVMPGVFKPGWVTEDEDGTWWCATKPTYKTGEGWAFNSGVSCLIDYVLLNSVIKFADDTPFEQRIVRVGDDQKTE